jgi:hypothetical protein
MLRGVSNTLTRAGLVMGNHRWKWSDLEKDILAAKGKKAVEDRKFMAILQYDDFGKKWSPTLIDIADKNDPFPNQEKVDNIIAAAHFENGRGGVN